MRKVNPKEAASRPSEPVERRSHLRDAKTPRRPICAERSEKGVENERDGVSHFQGQEAIKEPMRGIIDPHLTLADAGEAVTPEAVPDGQASLMKRPGEFGHQTDRKVRDIAPDRHFAAEADRPEPDENSDKL